MRRRFRWILRSPPSAAPIEQYIPEGWSLIDSACGLLDSDSLLDVVLVLERDEREEVEYLDYGYVTRGTTAPRVLLVLTGDSSGRFQLLAQGRKLLWLDGIDGPFHLYLYIENHELEVSHGLHGGGWAAHDSRYFRVVDDACVLVRSDEGQGERVPFSDGMWESSSSNTTEDYLERERITFERNEFEVCCEDCKPSDNCRLVDEDWREGDPYCTIGSGDIRSETLPDVPLLRLEEVGKEW